MIILVKAIAGSHLFGTNTESSDHDFKGVFLPSVDDLLLGKFDQTKHEKTNEVIGQKNTKDDVDIEYYSLDKFLKMLYQGQTTALELLFSPDESLLEVHPIWNEIRKDAHKFVNKKVSAFIGYTKTQADRYGIRGSRMETIEKSLDLFKRLLVLRRVWYLRDVDISELLKLEHVEIIEDKNNKKLLQICGKKFGFDTELSYIVRPLQQYYEEYGERSRLAKLNQGVDFKALSHSIRVSMQAQSLLTTGKIQLPMSAENVTILKDVKAGKYDYLTVAKMIEENLDKVLELQKISTLPEEPNLKVFQDVQIGIYLRYIKGEI